MTVSRFAEPLVDVLGRAGGLTGSIFRFLHALAVEQRLPSLGRSLVVGAPSGLATSYCHLLDPNDGRRALSGGY